MELEFYVFIDSLEKIVLLKSEIKSHIRRNNPNIIFPESFPDAVLAGFNYFPVEVNKQYLDCEGSLKPYCSWRNDSVYEQSGKWYVDAIEYLDESKINLGWEEVRANRNKLLENTDWITSSDMPTDIKHKYVLYRQLLRDCTNISRYPSEVRFPTAPELTPSTFVSDTLSGDEVTKIRNFRNKTPQWNKFLVEWEATNFTYNKSYVNNLLLLYTGLTVNQI
jgi:hypothetical protein